LPVPTKRGQPHTASPGDETSANLDAPVADASEADGGEVLDVDGHLLLG
jgi:hypothetical protein